jgi:hypothetical protein
MSKSMVIAALYISIHQTARFRSYKVFTVAKNELSLLRFTGKANSRCSRPLIAGLP